MAKPIEVLLPDGGSSYHVTVDEAWELVHSGSARWMGRKQIKRESDKNLKVTWMVRGESAFYSEGTGFGPKFCTLQVVA